MTDILDGLIPLLDRLPEDDDLAHLIVGLFDDARSSSLTLDRVETVLETLGEQWRERYAPTPLEITTAC